MTIKRYIRYLLRDLFAACGALTAAAAVYLMLNSIRTLDITLLWQIVLGGSSFTLFRYAFVNTYELDETAQRYAFFVCSLLADILLLILLFFFSPGRINDVGLFFAYLAIVLLIKAMVYAMLQKNARDEARQMNQKLLQFKDGMKGPSQK